MKRVLLLGASAAIVAGCNGNVSVSGDTGGGSGTTGDTGGGGADTGGAGGTGGDTGVPSDVNGTLVYRYLPDGPPVDVPLDLSPLKVNALVKDGDTWMTIAGNGHADGSFTIPAVPAGLFMLDIAGTLVYTSAHTLDLGTEIPGRTDAVYANGAEIAGTVDNLAPWASMDQLEWFDANANGAGYGFSGQVPDVGATSLAGESSPWYGALADGSKGDVVTVAQLSGQIKGGAYVYTIARTASFTGVQMANGATTDVSGSAALVTQDQSIAIDIRASEFAKLAKSVHPKAQGYGATFDAATLPGASEVGLAGFTSDLLLVYPGESDVNLGVVSYGNPYSPEWGTVAYAGETFGVTYKSPGASTPSEQYGSIFVMTTPENAGAGPLRPIVSPVVDPQIDGKSVFGPLDGVSATPTFSWKAPAIGQPSGYRVVVYSLGSFSGQTTIDFVTSITTSETTLPIPPDVLQKGTPYMFVITAFVSKYDGGSAPFHRSIEYSGADVLTEVLTP